VEVLAMSMTLPTVSCAIDYKVTWSVIKDVFAIVATVVGITGAVIGFNQWREIEWAKAEFDLSRRLLTAVFKTRDWHINSRRWMTMTNEFPEGYNAGTATQTQKREAYLHMFNTRFKTVRDCAVELQSLRPEAEARWGVEIVELAGKVLKCCHRLELAMGFYVRGLGKVGGNGEPAERQYESMVYDIPRNITVETPEGEANEFTGEMMAAVDAIEQYVHVKQKSIRRDRP
jgi:hypothetical protein